MHTEEKLTVGKHGVIVAGPFRQYTQGSAQDQFAMVCCPSADEVDKGVNQHDNARRLVACWNHCEKITTENLEAGPGIHSRALLPLLQDMAELAGERDELVKALRELRETWNEVKPFSAMKDMFSRVDAILAKYPEQL